MLHGWQRLRWGEKKPKCSSLRTRRALYVFSSKGSNLKTMAFYVLFSLHVSCVPFLDGISQWHIFPVGPWIHAAIWPADTMLQYQVDSLLLSWCWRPVSKPTLGTMSTVPWKAPAHAEVAVVTVVRSVLVMSHWGAGILAARTDGISRWP